MTKHSADTASTTKKFLAAGLALGVASLGLFASAGTAAADNYYNVVDADGTRGCQRRRRVAGRAGRGARRLCIRHIVLPGGLVLPWDQVRRLAADARGMKAPG